MTDPITAWPATSSCRSASPTPRPGALADYIPELARADPDAVRDRAREPRGRRVRRRRRRPRRSRSSRSPSRSCTRWRWRTLGLDAVVRARRRRAERRAVQRDQPRTGHGPPREPADQRGRDPHHRARRAAASSGSRAGLSAFAGRTLEVDEAVFAVRAPHRRPQPRDRAPDARRRVAARRRSTTCSTPTSASARCSSPRRDLAMMAATLANAGRDPVTGAHVVSEDDRPARAVGDGDVRHVRLRGRVDAARRAAGQERRVRRRAGRQPGAVRHRAVQPAAGRAPATASAACSRASGWRSASACTCCHDATAGARAAKVTERRRRARAARRHRLRGRRARAAPEPGRHAPPRPQRRDAPAPGRRTIARRDCRFRRTPFVVET